MKPLIKSDNSSLYCVSRAANRSETCIPRQQHKITKRSSSKLINEPSTGLINLNTYKVLFRFGNIFRNLITNILPM